MLFVVDDMSQWAIDTGYHWNLPIHVVFKLHIGLNDFWLEKQTHSTNEE